MAARQSVPAVHGSAIHRAVAIAVRGNICSGLRLEAIVRDVLRRPSGRVDRASYIAVLSGTSAYLMRSRPGPQWHLVGSEMRLDRAIADLVYRTGPVAARIHLVDELKTGMDRSALSSASTLDQLERLLLGAKKRWPVGLAGVRLVAPAFRFVYLVQTSDDLLALKGLPR